MEPQCATGDKALLGMMATCTPAVVFGSIHHYTTKGLADGTTVCSGGDKAGHQMLAPPAAVFGSIVYYRTQQGGQVITGYRMLEPPVAVFGCIHHYRAQKTVGGTTEHSKYSTLLGVLDTCSPPLQSLAPFSTTGGRG